MTKRKKLAGQKLAGCHFWWTNGRVGNRTKKSSFSAKASSRGSGTGCKTVVGSNLDASGIFFEMLRGRERRYWEPGTARETGSNGFVEQNNLSCGASFADAKTREKKPNRSLVEAKSDLLWLRVWSDRRVKLRLNKTLRAPTIWLCTKMLF